MTAAEPAAEQDLVLNQVAAVAVEAVDAAAAAAAAVAGAAAGAVAAAAAAEQDFPYQLQVTEQSCFEQC